MSLQFETVDWKKTVLYSSIAVGVAGILTGIIIAGYSATLAVQAQGAPDSAKISQFAGQMGMVADGLTAVLVFFFARRLGGRLQGMMLRVITAVFSLIISLISGGIELASIIAFAIIIIVGTIGGMIGESNKAAGNYISDISEGEQSENKSAPDWMSGFEES